MRGGACSGKEATALHGPLRSLSITYHSGQSAAEIKQFPQSGRPLNTAGGRNSLRSLILLKLRGHINPGWAKTTVWMTPSKGCSSNLEATSASGRQHILTRKDSSSVSRILIRSGWRSPPAGQSCMTSMQRRVVHFTSRPLPASYRVLPKLIHLIVSRTLSKV